MDQLGAMRVFIRVAQTGSFSAVGRELNTTQATISKKIAALEARLGAKLLVRSSRDISLTQAGIEYYQQAVAMLAELDEVETRIRSQIATPKGTLRITAPISFGRLILAPHINEFLTLYPEIKVDMLLGERHVDLITEGVDLAIRARKLEDSSLIAHHLFDNRMVVVASPDYLSEHGIPQTPVELQQHNCIIYSLFESASVWNFSRDKEDIAIAVNGRVHSDNGDTNLEMTLAGAGITKLPSWMVAEHIQGNRLQQILTGYQAGTLPYHAIYPQNRYVPLKVRCFIDFLKSKLSNNPFYQ